MAVVEVGEKGKTLTDTAGAPVVEYVERRRGREDPGDACEGERADDEAAVNTNGAEETEAEADKGKGEGEGEEEEEEEETKGLGNAEVVGRREEAEVKGGCGGGRWGEEEVVMTAASPSVTDSSEEFIEKERVRRSRSLS